MKGLRNGRLISKSVKRDILYTSNQLQVLTNHFYKRWQVGRINIPVHLIIWLAIYSGRRQAEISRLRISDFNRKRQLWKIYDLKSPKGSKGNNIFCCD
jgi:integrase